MKKLPVNVSDFEKLIEQNYLYIDKTKDIYHLISQSENYFICRPRRFGKSLLISTFECLFSGKKDLFKDLWIYDKYDFKEYPIIKLDFSTIQADSPSNFHNALMEKVLYIAKIFNLDISAFSDLNGKFAYLIQKLSETKGPVVILIDEYDDPIIKSLDDLKLTNEIRKVLIEFFKVIKAENKYLKFVFVTGITKFSKETIFSGMNNLFDLSLSRHGATLLGYTEHELDHYFNYHINFMAKKEDKAPAEIKTELKNWYNSYRFSTEEVRVYNPQSVLNYFFEQDFRNYWMATATSKLIVNTIKKNNYVFENLLKSKFVMENFTTFDIENISDAALFFQTGYLTIANYNSEFKYFELAFPNREVKNTINKCLLSAFTHQNLNVVDPLLLDLIIAIKNQNFIQFFETLKIIFANVPYQLHIKQERYYHSIIQIICSLMPFNATSEVSTDKGRIDMVIETDNDVNIFEFKFNSTPQEALKQIDDRMYYQKYLNAQKSISLLGVSFIKTPNSFDVEWVDKKIN